PRSLGVDEPCRSLGGTEVAIDRRAPEQRVALGAGWAEGVDEPRRHRVGKPARRNITAGESVLLPVLAVGDGGGVVPSLRRAFATDYRPQRPALHIVDAAAEQSGTTRNARVATE